ncbi:MAG: FecR domain-containing protein [Bacteroidota bacterium]
MENNNFKNEKAAKYWLHYFRRDDVSKLSEKELDEESDIIFKSLIEGAHASGPVKTTRLWYPMVAAAVAAILIVGSVILFNNSLSRQNAVDSNNIVHKKIDDVMPGVNSATLTLADGTGILLANAVGGQIANQTGVAIYKSKENTLIYKLKGNQGNGSEYNTVSTARGQQYQVLLPDGSSVWLNAASSIKFPANFASLKSRVIELTGEAYFEVARDKLHPFIVKTANQEVKVLGTHFNVNSYKDEKVVRTTLLEGSVVVSSSQAGAVKERNTANNLTHSNVVLKPGQQSQTTTDGIKIAKADLSESVAWKNGDFIFNQEEFSSILRQVARWYNVEIKDENGHAGLQLSGTVSRSRNLSAVLKALESAGNVKFKIDGKRVVVSE